MSTTLVIAEPGCTHEGKWENLVRLVDVAASSGADVLKPQWVSDAVQICERRHIGPDHPKRAYYERAYRWLQFPVQWHAELKRLCAERGLQYACTVFLPQDVATIAPFVDYIKVSSFESSDPEMAQALQCIPEPPVRLASYGMQNGWAGWTGCRRLHCVSAYPAPINEMNLAVLRPDEDGDSPYEGLSDHSHHVLTGAVAVGAGASIIETHFRLDECDPANPDYAVAFTPDEFVLYIKNVRIAERLMGFGVKQLQPSEMAMLPYRVATI